MSEKANLTTVRERMLTDELARIRSTYSFRLGILLTDNIIRKPWKIPLLPFKFLALNIEFVRSRKKLTETQTTNKASLDKNCIFLIATIEEGISSPERVASIAHEWSTKQNAKIVIMSPVEGMHRMLPPKSIVFPINDPKKETKANRTNWNVRCENLIATLIDAHAPSHVIFDGPYPYRGVLNAMKYFQSPTWIWLRPDGIKSESIATRGASFDKIIDFQIQGEDQSLIQPALSLPEGDRKNILLFAPHYGDRGPVNLKIVDLVRKNLEGFKWKIAYPRHLDEDRSSEFRDHLKLARTLDQKTISTMGAAIVSPNIEMISCLMANNVPTLCVCKEPTDSVRIRMLQRMYPRIPLTIADEANMEQLDISIKAIIQSNEQMRRSSQPMTYNGLLDQLQI